MYKKKIICFIKYYLPGYKSGGPVRTIANLINKIGNDYFFHIVTSDRDVYDLNSFQNIKVDDWNEAYNSRIFYISNFLYFLYKFPRFFRRESYDYIYLNSFFSFQFSIIVIIMLYLKIIPRTKIIIAPRGEFSLSALSIKKFRKIIYLNIFKFLNLDQDVIWQASSVYELNDIQNIFKSRILNIKIAPDIPEINLDRNVNNLSLSMNPLKIIFLSRISSIKNLDFAIKVLKELKINVHFEIVGPICDKDFWDYCLKLLKELPFNISYSYLGSIDHKEVGEIISQNHLFFLPTKSENYGHTIFESLSVGTPVLISNQTPWRDLSKHNAGWDISLLNKLDFVDSINNIAKLSPKEYEKKRLDSVKFVKNKINIEKILKSNKELFC
ncbi:glycosyltransferase [Prochlorococcus marinus XMU1411]|uniref:glycosyltransferase n=1 Tax=Prochlorococcus marinus TaxID=1219 RepID=UPI001ADA87D7|nr:glycosyltransferase [Prochlorococcus marinus]MBO8244203.1 glycosyltransferase [Prochlorococcus marinus XMU1411]MBW3055288.1 hypothetical protein [Prochlorococcus marinus str. MU1411]MCR8537031.1 glycosyltransferase [Prochlorococcus marinus CUG1430]